MKARMIHGLSNGSCLAGLVEGDLTRAEGFFAPASTRLLQSFAAWPVPGPPQCTDLLPMRPSSGCAALNAANEPPHCEVE